MAIEIYLHRLSNAASNALSVANAASNAASVVSQAVSVVSQALSVQAAALSVRVDTQSQSISVLSLRLYSSQLTALVSVSGLISTDNRVSNAISVVSQAVSVLSQAVSVAQAALSVRIDTQSQGISVLSQQISALSQNVSIVSNAASNALSVANAASNAASIVSNAVSALSVKTVGPAFSGQTLSTLIPPGAPTKVRIDAKFFDTDAAFDAVTNFRFTPLVAGRYLVMASTAIVLDGAATRTVAVYIYKNGASISQNTMITGLNVGLGIQTQALISVNGTTDYLEMFVYHDNTLSTLLTGYPQTQFSGAFVR